jgi:hypothetical protein
VALSVENITRCVMHVRCEEAEEGVETYSTVVILATVLDSVMVPTMFDLLYCSYFLHSVCYLVHLMCISISEVWWLAYSFSF